MTLGELEHRSIKNQKKLQEDACQDREFVPQYALPITGQSDHEQKLAWESSSIARHECALIAQKFVINYFALCPVMMIYFENEMTGVRGKPEEVCLTNAAR